MHTQHHQPAYPHTRGFTLLELLIVLVVVGVLTAVAFPVYQSQTRKSHRVQAKNSLFELASREERFYAVQNRYSANASDLGYASLPNAVTSGDSSVYYMLSVTVASGGQSYLATSAPVGAQAADLICQSYTLTQSGLKGNVDANGNPLASATCW
jgi:type IV pilus assembly protein PilE